KPHFLRREELGFLDVDGCTGPRAGGRGRRRPAASGLSCSADRPRGRDSADGRRGQAAALARSGMALGIAGLFLEAHPDPDKALCDGPSALPLGALEPYLEQMLAIDRLVKSFAP